MHHHLELLMPSTSFVQAAVAKVLKPFDENREEGDEDRSGHPFWDWYQLGGRYSGSKLEALVPQEKREAFYAAIKELKVTVSGLQWGKQELSPASQIPSVDALWREICPGAGDVCPFFKHAGDVMSLDVCALSELPAGLMAHTFIVAAPKYDGELGAETLLHKSIWNGCTYQETTWDGSVSAGLAGHATRIESYKADYREQYTPKPDWLVVTVDYHS